MWIIKGGWSKVDFDYDELFANPTDITCLLKSGTSVSPATPTEEFADGKNRSTLKQMNMSIRSANVDNAAGSAYALLKAAEENYVPLAFRFYSIGDAILVLKNVYPLIIPEYNELGKFNAIKIVGIGIAIKEEDLLSLNTSVLRARIVADCFGDNNFCD